MTRVRLTAWATLAYRRCGCPMSDPFPSRDLESALLNAIRQFFEERASQAVEPSDSLDFGRDDVLQLTTTVLFLQVIAADHESRHDEHQALVRAVSRVLHIDGERAHRVIRLAEDHVRTPLKTLLDLLRKKSTVLQRKKVIESLWQLAFADAELAGHEEYFVRKVSDSLGLSTADLVETKILAREAFLDSDS